MKKMMTLFRSDLLMLAAMWLFGGACFVLAPHARAEDKPALSIETTASGRIELTPGLDSPLFVEFEGSPTLTARLSTVMKEAGFQIAATKEAATVTVTLGGDLGLLGGPMFYKGARLKIGDLSERALASVKPGEGQEASNASQSAVSVALNMAGLASASSSFMRGLHVSRIVDVIGDQLGLKASLNTALTGDPRGWCLSRCENWKKVDQTAFLTLTVTAGEKTQSIRVKSSALSETLAPEQVVSAAIDAAMRQLVISSSSVAVNMTR